jgi:hypothetical protein
MSNLSISGARAESWVIERSESPKAREEDLSTDFLISCETIKSSLVTN